MRHCAGQPSSDNSHSALHGFDGKAGGGCSVGNRERVVVEQVALLFVLLGLRFGGVLGVLGDLFSSLASFALGDVSGGFGYQVERRGIAL